MFLVRLAKGLVKGLLLGALVGYGLAAAGFVILGPFIAYPMAALVGVVMALIAGKAIWEKDARIEVGMKALAGALLGPGLLWAVRRFLTMAIPIDVGMLPGVSSTDGATLGMFAVTSLALVAAMVGGFYDADHSEDGEAAAGQKRIQTGGPRVAADTDAARVAAIAAEGEDEAAEAKRARR